MEYNFTIKISENGDQLNLLYYINSELETFSSSERLDLFRESFTSMENDTVGSLNGRGRRRCIDWNSIEFSLNQGDTSLNSISYSRNDVESEMNLIPCTIEEFIEAKYLLTVQNSNI